MSISMNRDTVKYYYNIGGLVLDRVSQFSDLGGHSHRRFDLHKKGKW